MDIQRTSHTIRVVPIPARESRPMVMARLDTTMVIPVSAREYLDLPPDKRKISYGYHLNMHCLQLKRS